MIHRTRSIFSLQAPEISHVRKFQIPDNKTARDIVSSYLYCDDNAIGNTLAAFFSANAAGINWKSVHDNLLPLVQFAREQLMYSSTPLNGDEEELYHCVAQIKIKEEFLL